jgi:2-methylcitrate dehydratase PrpD
MFRRARRVSWPRATARRAGHERRCSSRRHRHCRDVFRTGCPAFGKQDLSARVAEVAALDLIDAAGLCIAARDEPYMAQVVSGWDSDGPLHRLGHARRLDAGGAALANGIAIHGEDFDDTLEGAPIRVGAMTIPAALAAAERFGLSGERAFWAWSRGWKPSAG